MGAVQGTPGRRPSYARRRGGVGEMWMGRGRGALPQISGSAPSWAPSSNRASNRDPIASRR
jgi:hypothetical protein